MRGPLVQSMRAFELHHMSHAEDWERQALLRARIVAGDAVLGERLRLEMEALAYETSAAPAEELAAMRARMELELGAEREDRYNVKLGYGGLVDVEFVAQWLALKPSLAPELRTTSTLRMLASLVAAGRLDAADGELFSEAYAFAREIEQGIKIIDPHREPILVRGGPIADRIARRRRMRARDGVEPSDVLVKTWIRTATEVRAAFDRIVSPVGTKPPWESTSKRS
jgi:glutamate-ammonia-ligase adenylyltransferase